MTQKQFFDRGVNMFVSFLHVIVAASKKEAQR